MDTSCVKSNAGATRLCACARVAFGLWVCFCACAPRAATSPAAERPAAATRAHTEAAPPDNAARPGAARPGATQTRSAASPTASGPAAAAETLTTADVGLAGPTALRAASPTGSWAAICQARIDSDGDGRAAVRVGQHGELHGDALQVYLVIGAGAGERVDDYVGHDPSGRFVAVVRDERLVLLDVQQRKELTLGAPEPEVGDDAASFLPHRAAAFSPAAPLFAYSSRTPDGVRVVLHHLLTGEETRHDPGEGLLWRVEFEPDGKYLRLEMITQDTNRNRRLEWPHPPALRPNRCSGPIPTYAVWSFPGDRPTTRLLRLSDPRLFEPAGLVMTLGDAWVTRSPEQELWLSAPGSAPARVSSESCAGRVLHADARFDTILFGCASGWGQRRQLYYRTPRERRTLGFDVAGYEVDGRFSPSRRLIGLRSRDASYLFDLARQRLVELEPGSEVLAAHASQALVARDDTLLVVRWPDGEAPISNQLDVSRPSLAPIQQRGSLVSVGAHLFDLASSAHLGEFERPPLSLTQQGLGLVPKRRAAPQRFAAGPLNWSSVTPSTATDSASSQAPKPDQHRRQHQYARQ